VLLVLSVVKAVSEIMAFSLIVQGVLYLVARDKRQSSLAYRMLAGITRPVTRVARAVMPRVVPDRYLWIVTMLMVFGLWVVVGQQKIETCLTQSREDPLCVELVKNVEQRRQLQGGNQ
jgi:hypothetical protein